MNRASVLPRLARGLEYAVLILAALGLAFHLLGHGLFPRPASAEWGTADLIDFGLLLLLFLVSTACAACGVAISLANARGNGGGPPSAAFRPLLVGITTFVIYYFVVPRLPGAL
ncbi:MAG: hypothetical protein AB7P42_14245 [Gammaproteobacteria bacterium]